MQQEISRFQGLRKIIGAKKGIIGVAFVKTDGSKRIMAVRRKTLVKVKGDAAAPHAKQARETRKKRHPHLVSVLEMRKGISQWRTLNLATMFSLRINGVSYRIV